ncbi:Cdc6/Cdc18 family protein [Natrarchaeobaculum aegyptiacum]|uniref:ORC1-type DNA replication protein n=1 Tax=Natrarchaeobaculum aegyptiacum TaxID=745377 RepID=A0A2Z2HZ63_9EURY|nr:ORC1-type DNA replication protein [Natrarchaeobaculum aegyptiacum]ARS91745.1 cell division control protein Ccd6 [Natrarchaeobaculum aegyptiacum]
MSDDDRNSRSLGNDALESDGPAGFSSPFESSDLGDDESNQGLFDDLLSGEPIFENKEVLRPSYTPHELPHRSDQINKMATILVAALRGETPSNILIYGKTGTGKTASAKFVSKELESTSQKYSVPCDVEYINCEVTDTQYRVLAQLANKFIEKNEARIDDRIDSLESLLETVDEYEQRRDSMAEADATTDPDRPEPASVDGSTQPDHHSSNPSRDPHGSHADSPTSQQNREAESPADNRDSASSAGSVDSTGSAGPTPAEESPTESPSPPETEGSADGGSTRQQSATDGREHVDAAERPADGNREVVEGNRGPGGNDHPLESTPFDSREAIEDRIEELEDDAESFEEVPMTGWPTDRVYSVFFDAVDYDERVVVIMLDEIDKLVEKSGDDTLYNLSRMNSELENSRVSIIGISNDLKFTDFLDPRVKSSLGEEEIVFPPYDANQLRDILEHRSDVAFKAGALSDDVIPLCAAFAAQEHGDARRALDLLRTAGELAERSQAETVEERHVREAQDKIELDRVVEVVRTLPTQSKLVLFAIISLEKNGVHSINTGEVFNIYKRFCEEIDADVLTQRRVTDLISELDMLGIVNAVVVSKGRYGRTKEINLSVPLEETEAVLTSDSRLGDIDDVQPFVQARFEKQK